MLNAKFGKNVQKFTNLMSTFLDSLGISGYKNGVFLKSEKVTETATGKTCRR